MATITEIFFTTAPKTSNRVPYIREHIPIEYVCDGKEGHIKFNGYYYVEDHSPPYPEDDGLEVWECPMRHSEWLPLKAFMHVKRREAEPYKVEVDPENLITEHFYKTLEEQIYMVEIYKRILYEPTDQESEIQDERGGKMDVCFFPTNIQTIYFRVLEDLA